MTMKFETPEEELPITSRSARKGYFCWVLGFHLFQPGSQIVGIMCRVKGTRKYKRDLAAWNRLYMKGYQREGTRERVLGRSVIAVCKKSLYKEVTESSSWVSDLLLKTVCLHQLKDM